MKIALISNVNSDLISFARFLWELSTKQPSIRKIVNLGDILGPGQFSNYCLEIARFMSSQGLNPEPVGEKTVKNNLMLGGIRDKEKITCIIEHLKSGVTFTSLLGKQDMSAWCRNLKDNKKEKSRSTIKAENLLYLLWHQYPERNDYIHRMKIKTDNIPTQLQPLEIRFAYQSWTDSIEDKIESYKKITNRIIDSGQQSISDQKIINQIQTVINKNFKTMKHWKSILFVGGVDDSVLLYKRTEQNPAWFIYEFPLELDKEYTIEHDHKYIVTVDPLGQQNNSTEHIPRYIILDIPDDTQNKPSFLIKKIDVERDENGE